MLLKCPECDLPVSDKALACPHCGNPMGKEEKKKRRSNTQKRMRLPNGFGSITELKATNLRKPFRARICVGKNSEGKPILKNLKPDAYFNTYNDAYNALMEYNKNPYDLDDDITVKELYERWTEDYFKNITESAVRTVTSAWAYCGSLCDMRAKDVRPRHIKGCIDDGYRIETRGKRKGEKIMASPSIKTKIKSICNLMFDYALEHEIVPTNYSRNFEISDGVLKEMEDVKKPHIIFTDDEIEILWSNLWKVEYVDWILIQIYMGWRPQELAKLRLNEIHLDDWYACAGMKTPAGKQRIVPIHTKIKELVKKNYDDAIAKGSEYLLNDWASAKYNTTMSYDKYANRFDKVINTLNLNPEHRPHDPRLTFVTRCKKAEVDEYAVKEMVGHSIKDITESTYTVRDLEWLRADLEKTQ